jgi:hypothetical protein
MSNFHSASCALRHNGEECTCDYIKPLTKNERAILDADELFLFMENNGDVHEISTATQTAIKRWRKKYGKK